MHEEYKRISHPSDKAILFVHGILGTPNHFKQLVAVIPEDISVYNILLDGHGKGVKDFSHASMKKWEAQVAAAVAELGRDHKEVRIVGHSMGTLLAIGQAAANPKITKLFLLAVPLKLALKPKMLTNSLRVYFNKIDPENEEQIAAKKCYGITDSKNILLYLGWVPRFLELFSKIRATRKLIGQVSIPCFVFQSAKDEMVSRRSTALLQKNPAISVTELKNSGHYYYEKQDLATLHSAFSLFIS